MTHRLIEASSHQTLFKAGRVMDLEGASIGQEGNNLFESLFFDEIQHFMQTPRKLLGDAVGGPGHAGLAASHFFLEKSGGALHLLGGGSFLLLG